MTSIKQSKTTYRMCNTLFKVKFSVYKVSLKYIISDPQTSHINMQHIILYNICTLSHKNHRP